MNTLCWWRMTFDLYLGLPNAVLQMCTPTFLPKFVCLLVCGCVCIWMCCTQTHLCEGAAFVCTMHYKRKWNLYLRTFDSQFPGGTSCSNGVTTPNESSGLLGHFHWVSYKQWKWLGYDPPSLHLALAKRRLFNKLKRWFSCGNNIFWICFVTLILWICFTVSCQENVPVRYYIQQKKKRF